MFLDLYGWFLVLFGGFLILNILGLTVICFATILPFDEALWPNNLPDQIGTTTFRFNALSRIDLIP
jgi:hypothetical protein